MSSLYQSVKVPQLSCSTSTTSDALQQCYYVCIQRALKFTIVTFYVNLRRTKIKNNRKGTSINFSLKMSVVLEMKTNVSLFAAKTVTAEGYSLALPSSGLVETIDNFDRPGDAFAAGIYAGTGTFAEGPQNKPGKRIPKAGVYNDAGVGYARAEWSVFDAEAKGPNAGVGAGVSATGAKAMARAELASASAAAGPVKGTVGLAVDTGASISPTQIEAKSINLSLKMSDKAVKAEGESIAIPSARLEGMIDTFDRPGDAFAAGTYAGAGTIAEGLENKPGKRIPKAGVYAGAGVGYARAEWSVFDAEAKGPNAGVGAGVSAASLSAKAMAKAELASASAAAGPVKATLGLAVDTGASISPTQIEAKVVGTGVSFGRRMGISLFGSGFEFELW
ncbi:hypothetical protein D9C73_010639 [Collichthys lucidus]|uniref:Uncharacterized protein n=1 Tax=Collichthys lucidus TaxID=240159 RepID=A0A4U5UQ79_COLLU|nr:hypothetical protein D9C73_010639 [Collichthys lucidus]